MTILRECICKLCVMLGMLLWGGSCAQGADQAKAARRANTPRMEKEWKRFVEKPHPMGSLAQKEYAQHLIQTLKKARWKAEKREFVAQAPARGEAKEKRKHKVVAEKGYNVRAVKAGQEKCVVMLAGHYDTKEFLTERFVGANDGGSSTVLLLELAWQLRDLKFPKGSWGSCEMQLVFFDGEEAFLKEWNDGEREAGLRDHLYGSRHFAENFVMPGKPLPKIEGKDFELLVLFDMVGHKNQKIFITQGSHPLATSQFVALKGPVELSAVPLGIEDDHLPFAAKGVPFVHLIDWTNLAEWHTPKDDLPIVSVEKLANLVEVSLNFLSEPRAK
jgi:glutaminyl-peptide cyclotransferase